MFIFPKVSVYLNLFISLTFRLFMYVFIDLFHSAIYNHQSFYLSHSSYLSLNFIASISMKLLTCHTTSLSFFLLILTFSNQSIYLSIKFYSNQYLSFLILYLPFYLSQSCYMYLSESVYIYIYIYIYIYTCIYISHNTINTAFTLKTLL